MAILEEQGAQLGRRPVAYEDATSVTAVTVHYDKDSWTSAVLSALEMFPSLRSLHLRPTQSEVTRIRDEDALHHTYYWAGHILAGLEDLLMPASLTSFYAEFCTNLSGFSPYGFDLQFLLGQIVPAFPNLTTIGDFGLEAVGESCLGDGAESYPGITVVRATLAHNLILDYGPDSNTSVETTLTGLSRIARVFPSLLVLVLKLPANLQISLCVTHLDDIIRVFRDTLQAFPSSLRVLRFEGPGLVSIKCADSPRPGWKRFFEEIGRGYTLVVGDLYELDGTQPRVVEV